MDFARKYFSLFCKGVAMGAADVVPGVSGGTIAFISGIYEQLLRAICAFNVPALKVLKTEGFVSFWNHVHGTFVCVLFSGILLSIVTFARLISHLLEHYPLPLWGFFFGLIVASVSHVWQQIPVRGFKCWIAMLLGTGVVLGIAFSPHIQLQPSPLSIFGAGMLAICAMILPGISGSFILLILGVYPVILGAITNFDLAVLAIFVAGCLSGLMFFSRFLIWLLGRFHNLTMAVLTGFLIGSLAVVWPWQRLDPVTDAGVSTPSGSQLFWPSSYARELGDPQWLLVIILMTTGFLLVLTLEYAGRRGSPKI
jgi:putative membrane protein